MYNYCISPIVKRDSNTSGTYATINEPALYETIEDLQQRLQFPDCQTDESQTGNSMIYYANTRAVLDYSNYIQMRSRRYSDSDLPCTAVYVEGEESLLSCLLPKRKKSEFSSLPSIPNHIVYVETNMPSVKDGHIYSSEYPNRADQDTCHKGYLTLMEATIKHSSSSVCKSHSLDAAGSASLPDRPQSPHFSSSCADICSVSSTQVKSNTSPGITTTNSSEDLSFLHPRDDHAQQHQILPSIEENQLNALAALNQEVYLFIANSSTYSSESDEYNGARLREIFERYCQNEKLLQASQSPKRNEPVLEFSEDLHEEGLLEHSSSNDSVSWEDLSIQPNDVLKIQRQED